MSVALKSFAGAVVLHIAIFAMVLCGAFVGWAATPSDGDDEPDDVLATLNPLSGLSLDNLRATREMPLFAPGRKPPPPPQPEPEPKPEPIVVKPKPKPVIVKAEKPKLALVGVVMTETGGIALLQDKLSGEFHRAQEGAVINNWRLLAVIPEAVIVERKGERHVLSMFVQPPAPTGVGREAPKRQNNQSSDEDDDDEANEANRRALLQRRRGERQQRRIREQQERRRSKRRTGRANGADN